MWSCLFLLGVQATLLVQDATELDLKERPVSKVIRLLKDMADSLEKEKAADGAIREKMECWCETNKKDKETAVDTANKRIDGLVADIGRNSGKSAELKATLAQLEKELAANQEALATATEVREKENEEFNADEKDMMSSIGAMKNAVLVLGKHHGQSFLQKQVHEDVKATLSHVLSKSKSLGSKQRNTIAAFMQQPNANAGSYVPASGQIFGILKQMKEEFENNLSQAQKDEVLALSEFKEIKKAKETEIAAGKQQLKDKTQGLADSDEALASAKEDNTMTREALAADMQFLEDLKLRCQQSDNDWEERSKTRQDEIVAIGETISILSDDDAHDTFGRTMGFVQTSTESAPRAKASKLLLAAAKKTGNLKLVALSSSVKLDAFTKVIAAIDDMNVALAKEQKDEVEHRDFCVAEFNENEKQTALKNREITELQTAIENAKATIASLETDLEALAATIKETETQMLKASEDREGENQEFQSTVADQRATQEILTKAKARMEVFYSKKGLLQTRQEPGAAVAPPPPAMGEYKKSGGAGGVMMLLQNIIDEAGTMEKEALKAEQDSQAAYEEFVKNANTGISNANTEITAKTDEKASTEAAKIQADGDHTSANNDAEALANYKGELHQSCDFIQKNFEIRQSSRQTEMDGLAQAKAVLSGMQ